MASPTHNTKVGVDGKRYPADSVPEIYQEDVTASEVRAYGKPQDGYVPKRVNGRTQWAPDGGGDDVGGISDVAADSVTFDPTASGLGTNVQSAVDSLAEVVEAGGHAPQFLSIQLSSPLNGTSGQKAASYVGRDQMFCTGSWRGNDGAVRAGFRFGFTTTREYLIVVEAQVSCVTEAGLSVIQLQADDLRVNGDGHFDDLPLKKASVVGDPTPFGSPSNFSEVFLQPNHTFQIFCQAVTIPV